VVNKEIGELYIGGEKVDLSDFSFSEGIEIPEVSQRSRKIDPKDLELSGIFECKTDTDIGFKEKSPHMVEHTGKSIKVWWNVVFYIGDHEEKIQLIIREIFVNRGDK
jgi:hypothetical protein